MTAKLILASASPIRQQMLKNAGVEFSVQAARVDEEALKETLLHKKATPGDIADALAELKATKVSAQEPGALVIGADQVLDLKGAVLSKPENLTAARNQLLALRGQQHKLISAVVVAQGGMPVWRHAGQANLRMRDFSDAFLEDYLTAMGHEVKTTVGCYKLEGLGVRLFSRIDGDYFTVLGMPLVEVLNYLSQSGFLSE
jgi:nucleoside triphosphate pyrophosphatase